MYCYVQTNAVVEGPRSLPETWTDPNTGRHYANLSALSQTELLSLGWYVYVENDLGAPGPYYDRTLSAFQINPTNVSRDVTYTQWSIERVRTRKNDELVGSATEYTVTERAINPKIDEYINNEAQWIADEQSRLARLTDWQQVADFDTTQPAVLPLANSFVGASYARQGLQLTAQNDAAVSAGQSPIWNQTLINSFVAGNRSAADDHSNTVVPVQPTFEIRQGIAVPSEQFARIILYREHRDDPNPALQTTYKMQLLNRQDNRDLYVFSYTGVTYLTWHQFMDLGNGNWGVEAHSAEWQYVPGDMAFIFSYGTNPAVEADYFTDRVEFPAGVNEMNILVAWDTA